MSEGCPPVAKHVHLHCCRFPPELESMALHRLTNWSTAQLHIPGCWFVEKRYTNWQTAHTGFEITIEPRLVSNLGFSCLNFTGMHFRTGFPCVTALACPGICSRLGWP
ncbi:hypothetical protein LEMLEM_LOCUS4852 [Lemmus lemmus]